MFFFKEVDIIQLTPYQNYISNFEALTSWSESDLKKWGAIEGFLPDSSNSWLLNNTQSLSPYGYGVCNNALPPAGQLPLYPRTDQGAIISGQGNNGGATIGNGVTGQGQANAIVNIAGLARGYMYGVSSQYSSSSVNDAFFQRMKWTNCYYPNAFVIDGTNAAGQTALINKAACLFNRSAFAKNPMGLVGSSYNAMSTSPLGLCIDNYMVSQQIQLIVPITAVGTAGITALTLMSQANILSGSITVTPTKDLVCSDSSAYYSFRQLITTCVIKFKSMCNLFEKLPLTRGLYMRIQINVNTGNLQVGTAGALDDVSLSTAASYPQYGGISNNSFQYTCPLMLAPIVASGLAVCSAVATAVSSSVSTRTYIAGCYPGAATIPLYPGVARDAGSLNQAGLIISVAIAKADPIHGNGNSLADTSKLQSHPLTTVRVYAPIVDMAPDLVSSYITSYKQQAVYYRDNLWFSQPYSSAQFNSQVGNGFVNLQRLVIMPYYQDDASVSTSGATINMVNMPFEPISPFSSAPCTVAPLNCINNFNVLVSNMNIYQRNISYSFENFVEEIGLANAINGGLDTGLTSGRIGYDDWCNSYRFLVVDLSRRLAGDNTPKSLTVIGTLGGTASKVTLMYFLQYRRHLSIDIESGHIQVSSN